ncbi:MAG: peptidoglycan editing factor PgeF [Clostridia bacterium]|nr:peptidoglycan editing factor PgeF [Clostridia bacterium]
MNNDFVFVNGKIPYYQSRLFNEYGVPHAFFTRIGGVSGGVFESLNFAIGAGDIKDTAENVAQNHELAASVFGLHKEDICRSYQTHTACVEQAYAADRGRGLTKPPYSHGVDGMVTTEKKLLLSVRSADCVPVLLCDKSKSVCAAVHAGWRGTVAGITKNAVELMVKNGARREDIIAAIGPCICGDCYEVGYETQGEFINTNPEYSVFFRPNREKYMLDLNRANEFILISAGIKPENVSVLNICTKCNEEHFYSHRRDGINRGTMSALIHI